MCPPRARSAMAQRCRWQWASPVQQSARGRAVDLGWRSGGLCPARPCKTNRKTFSATEPASTTSTNRDRFVFMILAPKKNGRPMRDARGAPRRIRTSDPRFRRPMLYPAELLAHELCSSGERGIRTLGKFPYTRLAGEHLRPLGQLSTDAYSIVNGGGGIRTPGACTLRFSRPPPSATRPLLQTAYPLSLPGRQSSYIPQPRLAVKCRLCPNCAGFGGQSPSSPLTRWAPRRKSSRQCPASPRKRPGRAAGPKE